MNIIPPNLQALAVVLILRTCGADGKHQWCEVLNTMQSIVDVEQTYCLEASMGNHPHI